MTRISLRKRLPLGVLAIAGLLGACTDKSPSGPANPASHTPIVASAVANVSSEQTAQAGATVPVAPAVVVKDAYGNVMASVTVRFTVPQGGGTVQVATALTNASGVASSGAWTLGSTPGANEVDALVGNLAPVRFNATAAASTPAPTPPAPAPPVATSGSYNITIRYLGTPSTRQQQAVARAVGRWQSAITGDLPDIPLEAPAGTCFDTQPAVSENVDDILIYVEIVNIDGPGKTLGESGPCYVRSDSKLPVMGHLKLDVADLQQMEVAGTLDDVVLHEMGHILGIGTLWTDKSLLTGGGTQDPEFTGALALAAYRAMGGRLASIPVENTGSDGTRDGHWRESTFGNELMTGYISGTPNPLSAMTIASLQDLGYGANQSAASSYVLGGTSGRVTTPIDLHDHERIYRPKYSIDRNGKSKKLDPLSLM
jgi:hypothetical protein